MTVDDAGVYTCSAITSDTFESINLDDENSINDKNYTTNTMIEINRIDLTVRTRPGAVAKFTCRATTIIAVIIWEVWPNRTGGHPLIYFTAELRRVPDYGENETEWQLLDPHHISPNAVSIIN